MSASVNIHLIFLTALCKESMCSSDWKRCANKMYYFSSKTYRWSETLKFCFHLSNKTQVADLGASPVDFAENCNFALSNKRTECWTGQRQNTCTILTRTGVTFKTQLNNCNGVAYPICKKTDNNNINNNSIIIIITIVIINNSITVHLKDKSNIDYCCCKNNSLHFFKDKDKNTICSFKGKFNTTSVWNKHNADSNKDTTSTSSAMDKHRTSSWKNEINTIFSGINTSSTSVRVIPTLFPSRVYTTSIPSMTIVIPLRISRPNSMPASLETSSTSTRISPTLIQERIKTTPILSTQYILSTTSVHKKMHTTGTPPMLAGTWVRFEEMEYYFSGAKNNYTSSVEYCKGNTNAALILFFSSIRYFEVLSQINLTDGSYWIGAHVSDNYKRGDDCLSYNKHSNTLSVSDCAKRMYSVCSRAVNIDNKTYMLENPGFKQMLKNMSVLEKETLAYKMKRISVNNDHRWSTAVAGVISLLIICLSFTFPLLIDLSKLALFLETRLCKRRKKRNSSSILSC